MKVTLAQLNPTVGDVSGNLQKVLDVLARHGGDTDLIVFSELFLVGYPPRDLVEKPSLIGQAQQALARLAEVTGRYPGTAVLVGAPLPTGRDTGKPLSDAAVLIGQGKTLFQQNKSLLPAYDVFDADGNYDARLWLDTAPQKFAAGKMYRFKEDKDTGVLVLSRYRVVWGSPSRNK